MVLSGFSLRQGFIKTTSKEIVAKGPVKFEIAGALFHALFLIITVYRGPLFQFVKSLKNYAKERRADKVRMD